MPAGRVQSESKQRGEAFIDEQPHADRVQGRPPGTSINGFTRA
jgi:hypothetical protein